MSDTGRCPHCEAFIGLAGVNAHVRLCELNPENNVVAAAAILHDREAAREGACKCQTCEELRTIAY